MALPHGWRFERASTTSCPHCHGTGKVETSPLMISPTGHTVRLSGSWTPALAREYAEAWAPERCSPSKRAELYGDQPQPGGNDGNQDPREGEAQAQDHAAT